MDVRWNAFWHKPTPSWPILKKSLASDQFRLLTLMLFLSDRGQQQGRATERFIRFEKTFSLFLPSRPSLFFVLRRHMAIGWFFTDGRNVDFARKNSSNSVLCWSSYFKVFYRSCGRAQKKTLFSRRILTRLSVSVVVLERNFLQTMGSSNAERERKRETETKSEIEKNIKKEWLASCFLSSFHRYRRRTQVREREEGMYVGSGLIRSSVF